MCTEVATRIRSDFQSPPWVCDLLAERIPAGVKTVLEPTPGEGHLVRALERAGYHVTAPTDVWTFSGWFDAVVMNPPFSPMMLGYRILERCMEMADCVIALMPWLVLINAEGRTERLRAFGLRSVTHLPRRAFPGARVQTCVLQLSRGYRGETALIIARPRQGG